MHTHINTTSKHRSMRKLTTIIILLATAVCTAVAQTVSDGFRVKGTVADSLTGEKEPYATIRIFKKNSPQNAVKMAVTQKNGQFDVSGKESGDFTIEISSMGREDIIRSFKSNGKTNAVDLGTLLIKDAKNEIEGVEVVAQKPLVKADLDKIEYNIEEDPESQSSTVMEMLRKVPMVTVDGEDNISINGSSSFKVYVNGKPNSMMSNNPKEVLKSMPANTIKRIEVITNPGPKYDAEGVGGILNIVTVGAGVEGYTATFSAKANDRGAGGGVYATVKKGKLTLSARYNYTHNDNPEVYSETERITKDEYVNASSSNIMTEAGSKYIDNIHTGSFEASYEIDTLRLVTASMNVWGNKSKRNGNGSTVGFSPLTGDNLYSYNPVERENNSWFSIEGSIDYQRLFKLKGRMLTLSYKISTEPDKSDSYYDYTNPTYSPDWEDFMRRLESQRNDGSENTTEHTFQVDYTTPIGKIHTLESGVKYIIRDNKSEDDRYTRPSESTDDYVFDEDYSSHYKHLSSIAAAYLGYGLNASKWSGRLGLRYEHTSQEVKYLLGRGKDFNKDYDNLVPSASIGYKLTEYSNLKIGYNMRIYRPGIWFLNPYLYDSNPTSISQGNPNLDSENSHSFDIGFNSFKSKLNLNFSARYTFTDNSIESVSSMVNDNDIEGLQNPTGKEVVYTTYRNIGKVKRFGINANANWNMTKTTKVYANIYGSWTSLSDGDGLSNKGWAVNMYGNIQQDLPKDWTVSFNAYKSTPYILLQGRSNAFFNYGLNVNKSFLKKRLTVSVFARNFLKKYMNLDGKTNTNTFKTTYKYRYPLQSFGINISYRIGELNANVKKAERTISNDDVKSGGGGQGN